MIAEFRFANADCPAPCADETGLRIRTGKDEAIWGERKEYAAANVGRDIKSDFPRDQVAKGFYANVDPRLRHLWKFLREKAASRGLGRVELLPLKYSGAACARYFTKYLTKALPSEKLRGDEKCRLFGVWGGVRFVHSRFSFLSSRIVQKRKQWLVEELELDDMAQLQQVLGLHWWFHFGTALLEVIMPVEFYKVGPPHDLRWDSVGLNAFARDCAAWPGPALEDSMNQSRFSLLRDIGAYLFGPQSREALQFAMNRMARPAPPVAPIELDPQLILSLEAAIERTRKNSSP